MVPGNNRIYQGKKSKSNLNLLTKGTSEVSAVLIGLCNSNVLHSNMCICTSKYGIDAVMVYEVR